MSAVSAVHHVIEEYKRFLRTSYRFLDPHLREQFEEHLREGEVVVKGPYVTLSRDFERGKTLRALVDEGLVVPDLLKAQWPFGDEGLFAHQEQAARIGLESRPFLVTTGTGSGKTECFLLPIFDHCIRAHQRGEKGVKAVLLYPMNALAHDQLERLRRMLRDTGLPISFGLYVGESDITALRLREKPAQTERLTRQAIRNNPPDILLTNYKQMEFLLVRREDRALFGPNLRFLVLDEIHTYRGALATEIACLIRRLKAHAGLPPGRLLGIGTSATVAEKGGGAEGMAQFATVLFGEKCRPEDVLGETPGPPTDAGAEPYCPAPPSIAHDDIAGIDLDKEEAVLALAQRLTGRQAPEAASLSERISRLLEGNEIVRFLEDELQEPESVQEVAESLRERFVDRAALSLEGLRLEVEAYLLVGSVGDEDHPPRLRPKLHTFFHGVYDVGICLNPDCRALVRHGSSECPNCGSAVRPAAICRTCGQDFVKVKFLSEDDPCPVGDDSFVSEETTAFLTPRLHSLVAPEPDGSEEEAEEPEFKSPEEDRLDSVRVCPGCGRVGQERQCPTCNRDMAEYLALFGKGHQCPACRQTYTRGDILTLLRTGHASTVSVLTTHHLDHLEGEDRKILVFADNRQDAAHQAGYMADRHRIFAIRHLIEKEVREAGQEGLALDDIPERLFEGFRSLGIITGKVTKSEREKWIEVLTHEAASEFCRATQQRMSLENLGLVAVEYEFLDDLRGDPEFQEVGRHLNLSDAAAVNLVRAILDYMRRQRAVTYSFFQEYLDPSKRVYHELQLEPYRLRMPDRTRRPVAFALDRPDHLKKRFRGFCQENPKSGSLPGIQRLVTRLLGDRRAAQEFLQALVPLLRKHEILEVAPIPVPAKERVASVEPLQIAKRIIRLVAPGARYRCPACQTWRAYDFPICPTPDCKTGRLQQEQVSPDHYYVRLYTDQGPRRLAVMEHSAQIRAADRATRESDFKEGRLDALVCTPTLELGVDIGPLLTVLMRNAPPTPAHYAQRVGRAGRRLRIGFVSTFCGPGAHDRHAFENPPWLAAGQFHPPRVRLDNPRIVDRHLRSYALELLDSALPPMMSEFLDDVKQPTARIAERLQDLYAEVAVREAELVSAAARVFEHDRAEGRTDRYDEDDVRPVVQGFRQDLERVLDEWWDRVRQLDEEFRTYATVGSSRHDERKASARKRAYFEITQDHERAYTLNYLATAGLLPAYQFPTDTFWLEPGVDDTPTIFRAAAIAIEEFAPGNLVYANGHKLRSIRALFAGGAGKRPSGPKPTDLETSGRLRSFFFCPQCDFATEEMRNNCPVCGAELGAETSVAFLEGFEAEEATRITAEEEARERGYFVRKEALMDETGKPSRLYPYPFFPVEHRRDARLLVTNWGRGDRRTDEGERIAICPECGRHRPPHQNDAKGQPSPWDAQHAGYCSGQPIFVVLGYEFNSDALVITVPGGAAPSDAPEPDLSFLYTLAEGLSLGAATHLEVEPGEVSAFVRRGGPSGAHAQIVLYETVPGGAGYLEELAGELPAVARAAYDRLFGHACVRACYQCLKRYENQGWHQHFDKERVRDTLFHLGLEQAQQARDGTAGQGASELQAFLTHRVEEAQALRATGETGRGPESPIESALLSAIRRVEGLPEPTAQVKICEEGRLITIPDFAYEDAKIAIYCDGYQYHGDPDTLELDARKRNYLQSQGWAVLTYWGRTIMRDADTCARLVDEVYKSRT